MSGLERKKSSVFVFLLAIFLFMPVYVLADTDEPGVVWNSFLKKHFFGDRKIDQKNPVIEIEAPRRAANPALVPISIASKIVESADRYIKTIYLIIDKNPKPLAGKFSFTRESGKASLSMRIRVNAYSQVRAIAELNDGSLSMVSHFVKATGGCSAPVGSDIDRAMARLGKMKLFPRGERSYGGALLAQLRVSHPNVTGLQMDQLTRLFAPAHYVKKIEITFNGKSVLSAETDISISEDPSIGFYFMATEPGVLRADVEDTNGLKFSVTRVIAANN